MTPHDNEDAEPVDEVEVEDIEIEEPEIEEPEPGLPSTTAPEPPANTAGVAPQDHALAGLSPDLRAETMRRAATYGVVHADDPLWVLVRAVVESHAASQAAGVAAETTQQAIKQLDEAPARIERAALEGASKAAADIQQHAAAGAEAIVSTLGREIETAAAEPLRRALKPYMRDLEREAGDVRAAIRNGTEHKINQMTGAFLRKTRKEIDRRSAASKTAGRLSAVLLLAIGAVIGIAGAKLDHHWSPTPVHSAPGGGFTVQIPPGHSGRFKHCGNGAACAFIYPTHHGRGVNK